MTRPDINVVMECHDVSIQPSEHNLHLPGKYLNSFSSTPGPGCFSSRMFNAKVWLSVYLTGLALQSDWKYSRTHARFLRHFHRAHLLHIRDSTQRCASSERVLFDAVQRQPRESALFWKGPFVCLFLFWFLRSNDSDSEVVTICGLLLCAKHRSWPLTLVTSFSPCRDCEARITSSMAFGGGSDSPSSLAPQWLGQGPRKRWSQDLNTCPVSLS